MEPTCGSCCLESGEAGRMPHGTCRPVPPRSGLFDAQAADRPGDDELLDLLGALENVVAVQTPVGWVLAGP
jgi:hypothetical protein